MPVGSAPADTQAARLTSGSKTRSSPAATSARAPGQGDLVFDIGVSLGNDSAYYLHRGFRVVGVEASPIAVAHLEERFKTEIEDGRYTLVPLGISDTAGKAEFWVCDDCPEWSSFDKVAASYNGKRHHAVEVETCRFASIITKFGVPYYCKIDIEGKDDVCLDDLAPDTAPAFISIEASDDPEGQLRRLSALGYGRFKIISQFTLRQPRMAFARFKATLPFRARLIVEKALKLSRIRSDGDWRFPAQCSGPFGDAARGRWLNLDEAIELNRLLVIGSAFADWQDIHAGR